MPQEKEYHAPENQEMHDPGIDLVQYAHVDKCDADGGLESEPYMVETVLAYPHTTQSVMAKQAEGQECRKQK